MALHSSTLAWKIPWMEEPGRLQSMGSLELHTTEWLHFHFSLSYTGEGNGNPLQCSCLENPRDGEAWWTALYGSHRVGHDWSDLAAAAAATSLSLLTFMHWRRKWQPTPAFLPGESQGRGSLSRTWLKQLSSSSSLRLSLKLETLLEITEITSVEPWTYPRRHYYGVVPLLTWYLKIVCNNMMCIIDSLKPYSLSLLVLEKDPKL